MKHPARKGIPCGPDVYAAAFVLFPEEHVNGALHLHVVVA